MLWGFSWSAPCLATKMQFARRTPFVKSKSDFCGIALKQSGLLPALSRQFLPCAHFVRPTRRFGETVTGAAVHDNFDGVRQVNQMAGRNVERIAIVARPQHRANDARRVVLVAEFGPLAALWAGFGVPAVEPRFGDADAGPLQPQAHLRSNADAARVRDALPIEHEQVGLSLQLLPRG